MSGRVVPTAVTEARVIPLLPRIPVTRVTDLTPLDPIRLPVFTAVTPLARDLTTHMGKGMDRAGARVSSLMEAIERICAEQAPTAGAIQTSFRRLRGRPDAPPLDPMDLTLPDDTGYRPHSPCTWVQAHDLTTGDELLIPADLVSNPPAEGILREVDTNGLASGNNHLEAVVHAICEVIERDIQSQLEFASQFADEQDAQPPFRSLDLGSLPDSSGVWVERLLSHGLDVQIHDITNEIGVASFRVLVSDYTYPSPSGSITQHFVGWGTAPNAELALVRAVTEAVQSRLGIVQASRDSFNTTRLDIRAASRGHRRRLFQVSHRMQFSSIPSFVSTDLHADLTFLLEHLHQAGFRRVIAADLTRADLGVPVVRVRVPGLATFSVNRRRVDWRCLRYLL